MDLEQVRPILDELVVPEQLRPAVHAPRDTNVRFSVTDLLRFVPTSTMVECFRLVNLIEVRPRGPFVHYPLVSSENEQLSDITGVAVVAWFEKVVNVMTQISVECTNMIKFISNVPKHPSFNMVHNHFFEIFA
jgi:hypothetical protein